MATVARSTPSCRPEQDGGRGEDGAGVAGGDERVGAAGLLKAETDDDAGFGFLADGGEGLLGHADDLGRLVKLYAAAGRRRDTWRARPG